MDEYQDLLRISVASAGNDHRLGANEAPPAIVSIFTGDELAGILKAIETDTPYGGKEKELMKIGVHILPKFPKTLQIETELPHSLLQVTNLNSVCWAHHCPFRDQMWY